jgi:lysophospholipase L1-like esterase
MSQRDDWWLWLLGLRLLVGFGVREGIAAARATPQPPPPGARVLLIGDSLAVGLASPMRKLAESSGVTFASDARGGTVTRQWLSRGWAQSAIANTNPTIVVVSLGTNDAAGKISAPAFAGQAAELAALARKAGARVAWLVPPPMPYSIDAITTGLRPLPVSRIAPPADLQRSSDRIHCTPAGYQAWAAHAWQQLSEGPP